MNAGELRQKAMHYRRVARLVSDEAITEALLDLAAICYRNERLHRACERKGFRG
jgi:hypothetical protein